MDTTERPKVKLFTDGACIGNPGPGGWGFILQHPASGRTRQASGGEYNTTNNRMEIMAVIRGLAALTKPSQVELCSDSQYVINAISQWMPRWKAFGWRKTPKSTKPLKNKDLWMELDRLLQCHQVTVNWVRGHVGHCENEQCDTLAATAAAQIAETPPPPAAAPAPATEAVPNLFGMNAGQ